MTLALPFLLPSGSPGPPLWPLRALPSQLRGGRVGTERPRRVRWQQGLRKECGCLEPQPAPPHEHAPCLPRLRGCPLRCRWKEPLPGLRRPRGTRRGWLHHPPRPCPKNQTPLSKHPMHAGPRGGSGTEDTLQGTSHEDPAPAGTPTTPYGAQARAHTHRHHAVGPRRGASQPHPVPGPPSADWGQTHVCLTNSFQAQQPRVRGSIVPIKTTCVTSRGSSLGH